MIDLGTVRPGSTIRIPFNTFDKDDGSSITMTLYAAADILVYKDGSAIERASTAGYTATTDFDAKTGKQLAIIDLADNTTANFWAAGSEYLVAIDSVTVDAVTTGGWIARFRIGYAGAVLDTTIATLASQTSFTLTSGPAEDDALNGMWAVIHDIASAVQMSWVQISDYTGATKTVTLAAGSTFTAAANDNISVMFPAPLQPTTTGNKADVTATGGVGVDWGNVENPTTANALTGTTIATTQKVDVETIKTQTVTAAGAVTVGAFVGQATAAIGVNASGHVSRVVLVDTVTTLTNLPAITANWLTAAGIAASALNGKGDWNIGKTGYALSATGLDLVLVDGKTLPAALQYIGASVAGKVSGAGTATEIFVGLDGATTRLTVTADASGNRSAVVYG